MATNINAAFITQWNDEVKHAYQQKGSKLRECVYVKTGVVGSTQEFHTMGEVIANSKTRDADVIPLNPAQTTVVATLEDRYAPIYVDKLDEVKTNIDARREFVMTSAAALGRRTDQQIIASMDLSSSPIATTAGGLTYAKLLEALEVLNNNDVDEEDRVLVIAPSQLSEVLAIPQLTSSDYSSLRAVMTGSMDTALGFKWVKSTQLTIAGGIRECYAFNRRAVGLAIGMDINTEVSYIPEKVSTLVNSFMSMGSVVIDVEGVVNIQAVE